MEPVLSSPSNPTDPSDLEQLGERIAELAAQITAATFQLLTLIREFDEREGWHRGYHGGFHEEGYRIETGHDGQLQFLRPDGSPIPAAPAFRDVSDRALAGLVDSLVEAGVDVEEMPGFPEWDGSSLDLAWAVDGLRASGAGVA